MSAQDALDSVKNARKTACGPNGRGAMPSEHDERKRCNVVCPSIPSTEIQCELPSGHVGAHKAESVVELKARALASEQRAEQSERERDRVEDLRLTAEQRVRDLETQIGGAEGRMAELELEATELFAQRNGIDQQRESAEALLAKARAALEFYGDERRYVFAAVDETGDEWSSPVHEDDGETARAVLAEITTGNAPEVVHIARCPEHGLHGCRQECFECGGPVEQVPMVEITTASKETRDG